MADSTQFKKGDVVSLKSGGPPMTVTGEHAHGFGLNCVWFDHKNERKNATFQPESLILVTEEESE